MIGEELHEAHDFLVFQTTDVRLGHEAGGTGLAHVPLYQRGNSLLISEAAAPLPQILISHPSEDTGVPEIVLVLASPQRGTSPLSLWSRITDAHR